MKFLVDAQLPPALARWLVVEGYRAEHVMDIEMDAASDAAIWRCAARIGATILTKDEDFAILRTERRNSRPAIVWLRVGNTRRGELLRWFEPLLPRVIDRLERGEKLIEVR